VRDLAAGAGAGPRNRLCPGATGPVARPIALYPDPLVALVLPASTAPADVVLAARYVSGGGDASQIDGQPWDASVKALARYPDVIRWLDANLDFTQALGAAFAQQPADVMQSIQRLRAQAQGKFPEKVTAFREQMAAHGKYGQPCPRCGGRIQRIRYADNETDYCAHCQTGGKVLADRGLSRLLGSDWPRTLDELEALKRH